MVSVYTVVGLYLDEETSPQRFATHVIAESPDDAARLALAEYDPEATGGLTIAGVFAGSHDAVDGAGR